MKKVITISIVLALILIPVFNQKIYSQNKTADIPYLCEEDWIEVMFIDASKVRMRDNNLTDLSLTDALSGVDQVLNNLSWHNWFRFCDVPESTIDQWETNGEKNSGTDVYNLNNIYRLQIPKGQDIWEISRELENLPGIYKAMPVPKPMELPTPPNYQSQQGYLNPATSTPTGIDALYAWTKTGGTGSGITVCDLEYSWNYSHNDISKAAGSQINTNVSDPFNDNNHGTAVIGELVADNNGWGTTGICYGAALKTCGTNYGTPSATWNVPGAIAVAISNLSSGDVILLEQQWEYTSNQKDYIPIEWWGNNSPNAQTNNGVYAAIVNAITNGISVVEAGGNGAVNTDNLQWYGNSGAIIVGAGGATTTSDLQKLSFSSYGQRFDMQGWGENVFTTGYGNYYNAEGVNSWYTNNFNGTSSASPIVAAAVACTQGYYTANISSTPMTPSSIRSHLKTYGTPQITPPNGNIGPRPDLKNAIDNLQAPSNWDWGDAPDANYQTLASSSGATHSIGSLFLGYSVDGDPDGQPTTNADGDDNDGNDDEDGVIFNSTLYPGGTASVTVIASQPGYLQGWMDFNQNGSWGDAGDQIFTNVYLYTGSNNLSFTIPMTANFGPTYARFRLSSFQGLLWYGSVTDGEVEDYYVFVDEGGGDEFDWGDAPDPAYPTLASNNGANHYIDGMTYLGYSVDPESDGQPNPPGLGDDNDGNDDEDGVTFTSQIIPGQMATVDVVASVNGLLNAWIDFDNNGSWADPGEQIFLDFPLNPGLNAGISFNVPPNAIPGQSYARFRFSTQPGLSFTGSAPDGEVEDYEIMIDEGGGGDLDWGDAPDQPYPTLAANNGANHFIDGITYLGNSVDPEFDGQPYPPGLGDDNDGNDDEDGVAFTSPMNLGNTATMDVTASVSAFLSVWIDFNQNGTWADPGEMIFADYPTAPGVNNLSFAVPASATLGVTYMRFRFSNQQGLNFDGPAQDGEVEDYEVEITEEQQDEYDWGDASDPSYPTLASSNGANHLLDGITFMGASVDAEPDGQPDPNALGDDNNNLNDEDGVTFVWPVTPGNPVKVVVNASVSNGFLNAWFDFNRDGDWADTGEQIFTDVPLTAGNNTLNFNVPANAVIGTSYTRFRFSTQTGLSYNGSAPDGEVEDYEVEIEENGDNKWAQWPDPALPGLHDHDYMDATGVYTVMVKADDWQCNGGLVTDIHWWGNYELDATGLEKRGAGIDHFHLSIHTNNQSACLPIDPEVWGADIPFPAITEQNTGMTNNEGSAVYLYEYILDQPFEQDSGSYYWLDITAFSVDPGNPAMWRWQESMRSNNPILCAAAEKEVPPDIWNPIYWQTQDLYSDMAFIITSTTYEFDYGDANDPSYPTLLANNGARHIIDNVTYLGSLIDAEPDGQPDPNALGDDNNNLNDEDGVTFTSVLMQGQVATVDVVASVSGFLNAWMDFNGNGSWGDAGEQIFTDLAISAGTNSLTFSVPSMAIVGTTYSRFRFSTQQGLSFTGSAPDGEVEDYEVEIEESNIKWIQNPDPSLTGLHAHDYDNAGSYEDIILADDWICGGGWVSDIHWWGAYDSDGNGNELRGAGINYFHLSIHTNDTTVCLPMDPEVWGYDVPFVSIAEINTGMINSDGDTIYLYEFDLPEPFQQIEGHHYWLDITAISLDYQNPALWKWQLSSATYNPILCGAAQKIVPNPGIWQTMWGPDEMNYELAFIITSVPVPDMDYGDADDPTYPTLLASNGARHIIDGVTFLGSLEDAEPDGLPDPNALGDDNDNLADEDGVSLLSPFFVGGSAMINITASVNGILNAWIDYNNDGDWNDANEQIFTDQALSAGGNSFVIPVPNNAIVGNTYARYRFSTATGLQPTGLAPDGEVEDYEVEIKGDLDFGDAPDPYPTLMASNGARHIINTSVFLGDTIDYEPDGLPDTNALGDDNNNFDDEDGVMLPSVIVPVQQNIVTVIASTSGYINAWIDYNGNGSWADLGEQIFTDQAVTAGPNTLIFTGPLASSVYMTTFARFRFSTVQGLSFTGQAPDGEVEDYEVEIGPAYKWLQEPDLSNMGMDVNATMPNLLADDFRCTTTGPLTKITVWGSWFKDHIPWHEDPSDVIFTLSIHEDIPADQSPTGYSMPGNTIWIHTFYQGDFTTEVEASGLLEGWYDPALPLFDPSGDTVCWKYTFDLQQLSEPFIQTGTPDEPVIYWLDVQAQPLDQDPECMFGWKTSQQHFNDDAVWTVGTEPYNDSDWNELHYPAGHPLEGQSVDLAFSIEGLEDGFILVDLKAFLEGPFNGTTMSNDLNDAGLIPVDQPYDMDATAKWYYTGSETVFGVPSDATDWILVELRDASSASTAYGSTMIAQKAAFILNNGSIVATDGSSMLKFYVNFVNNAYVVLWHRNHLGVLSNAPMNQPWPGVYTYDFTTGAGQAYNNGQKDLGCGIYGMFGGDGNPDELIDNNDKAAWKLEAGTAGYLQNDYNLDTQVDNKDKNDIWVPNETTGTQVPN